jgi:hypothetical protein
MNLAGSTSVASEWFSKFANFAYDPTSGLRSNFNRLAAHRKWEHKLNEVTQNSTGTGTAVLAIV